MISVINMVIIIVFVLLMMMLLSLLLFGDLLGVGMIGGGVLLFVGVVYLIVEGYLMVIVVCGV